MSADEGNSTDIVDLIQGFARHVNAPLNETLLEAEKHQNFGASVESLGLTSIIVISVACVLAFAGGLYCALKRTKRKATKIVSIRSIGNIGSQASLMSDAGPPGIPTHNRSSKKLLSPTPSSGGTEFHTPQQPEPTRAPPHTHTS